MTVEIITPYGDQLIGVKRTELGAIAQNLHNWIQAHEVTFADFGATGDGSTDDTAAVQAALNTATKNSRIVARGTSGGSRFKLNSITIPDFISVSGPSDTFGMSDVYDATTYSTMGATFLLTPGSTINIRNGSALSNLHILPSAITFPQTGPGNYAGTAITANAGVGVNTVDPLLRNLLIVGFNQAVDGRNVPRVICDNVNFDCNNGIAVNNAGDPIRFYNCHGWPFGTIAGAILTTAGARDRRPGTAFSFSTNCDAGKITNCFAFGYNIGFHVHDVNGLSFINCGSDDYNLFGPLTSTGWLLDGTCPYTSLIGCQSVAHNYGVTMDCVDDSNVLSIIGGLYGANTTDNIHQLVGTVSVTGALFGSAARAVGMYGATNRLLFDNNVLQGLTSEIVLNNAASPYCFIGDNNVCRDIAVPMYAGSAVEMSVAAAATVNLPQDCDNILITGNTNIFGFTGGWPGRVVHLRFSGTPTLSDAAGMQMNGNFNATNNSTITFKFTSATQCYECARSAN